jgi:hypothetical protein
VPNIPASQWLVTGGVIAHVNDTAPLARMQITPAAVTAGLTTAGLKINQ